MLHLAPHACHPRHAARAIVQRLRPLTTHSEIADAMRVPTELSKLAATRLHEETASLCLVGRGGHIVVLFNPGTCAHSWFVRELTILAISTHPTGFIPTSLRPLGPLGRRLAIGCLACVADL